MASPRSLLALALIVMLLPAPWGVVVGVASRPWTSRSAVLGLMLLAIAAGARSPTTALSSATDDVAGAVRLSGHWRTPPGGRDRVMTSAGSVPLRLATDVRAPLPGTPVTVLARTGPSGTQVVHVSTTGTPRGAWLDRWCLAASRRLDRLLIGDRRGLAQALVLGQRQALHPDLQRACRDTGTMHLLALSGLHVALLAALLGRWVPARRRALHGVLLLLFVLLAGAGAPLRRALAAWVVAHVGLGIGRAPSALHRLAVVALLLLIWDPSLGRSLSAQLSFLAVAGLLAAGAAVPPRLAPLAAPAGAFLATAPLVGETFGVVQPWGVVVTPLLVPLVAVVLGLGGALALTGPLLTPLDGLLGPVLDGAAALLAHFF